MDRLSDIGKIPSVDALERVQGLRDRGQNQDRSSSYEGPKPGEDEAPVEKNEEGEVEMEMTSENEPDVEDPGSKTEGDASCQDGGAVKGRHIDIKA